MTSETEILTPIVEGTSINGNLASSIEKSLLLAFRRFCDIPESEAEVLVFTDKTPGHAWNITMNKTVEGELAFYFTATHLPAPCTPNCEPEPVHVAESDWLNKVFAVLVDHIACVAREEAVPCCLA